MIPSKITRVNKNILREKLNVSDFINCLIPVIALIIFAFLPTSFNSVIFGVNHIILIWSIIALMTIILAYLNKIDKIAFLSIILILIYLIIVTMIQLSGNMNSRISLARIAPIICLFCLSSIVIVKRVPYKLMEILLDIFCIAMIVWNISILLDISIVKEFTRSYFSQYYDSALFYSMMRNKPVMSFGVHTYAAYFYMFAFYICFVSAKKTNRIKYYIYCSFIAIFTVFLTSNTSIVYAAIMFIMLITLLKNKPIFLGLAITVVLLYVMSNVPYLIERYSISIHSETNGLIARYFGAQTVFDNNINMIKNSLGIGFSIIDNIDLGYSDSGYMVYLTMGHIPFVIGLYALIIRFFKKNVSTPYFWFICFVVLSFEFALPATFNYRYPMAIIFVVYYLSSLDIYHNYKNNKI